MFSLALNTFREPVSKGGMTHTLADTHICNTCTLYDSLLEIDLWVLFTQASKNKKVQKETSFDEVSKPPLDLKKSWCYMPPSCHHVLRWCIFGDVHMCILGGPSHSHDCSILGTLSGNFFILSPSRDEHHFVVKVKLVVKDKYNKKSTWQ